MPKKSAVVTYCQYGSYDGTLVNVLKWHPYNQYEYPVRDTMNSHCA